MSTICKNCGGDSAIHHYVTNQCPAGGHEAYASRVQVWQSSTFEPTISEVDELRQSVQVLLVRVEELEARIARLERMKR